MHDRAGEHYDRYHREELNQHERHRAPIDLSSRHAGRELAGDAIKEGVTRRHRAQIEQRETERRMQERRLHIDTENDAEPDQVDAEMFRRRTKERDHDEGELEIIEEEGELEDEGIDEQQKANLPAGQRGEQAFHPDVAADAVEG